ncbi:chromosome segregation protein [Sphingomonas sp. Leaf67]|uniref:chromosome segregation SMC family protein n=1 Tax=Sphingomonas sp. Leaf67 TaxID=1736230 RepID=UPI0006F7A51F|nr:AAA family ATPase [Sphingomonas sp. Leaf67]KQN87035.1 chromosome segregation protein [Sphingomonas sp. Leaf67]
MTLRRLRLGGFKSFVDPADLVIEAGLTGVVGPNGCGKSNLLEALRWTMGENSAKSLRGAGMDDVIFAGTATRPQRDFAEVAILAEDANGDEVEIVRRIERGAGSAYRINGRDVRAKDVSLLFADAATGAHSPALVSQNRIGAVIAARPAERRAMLEEAAGIAGLHVRRRDAEGKLRATEANLDRLGEMAHEQDARAATLRRQARVAARYRELTDAIRVAEARAIYARWRDAVAAADAATAEAKAAEALVAGQAGAQGQAAGELSGATQALATARADAERLRQQVGDVGHARERVQAQANAATRRLADLTAQAARLTEDRAREAALAGDAETAVARLEAERARLADTLAEATARLPLLDTALDAATRAAAMADTAHAEALAAQAAELAEARVATAAHDAARARLDRVRRDEARLLAEQVALSAVAPLFAERTAATERRAAALTDADTARAAITNAEAADRSAQESRDRAQSDRAAAAAELAAIDSEIAALDRALRRGGRARIIDSVVVEPGFEAALAAALGDDLDAGTNPADDRYWQGDDGPTDGPAIPIGVGRLSAHVAAPLLARRLAQILVVERDEGTPLAVGQRLVTLDGALRRWDGLRSRAGSGAAAAERLARTNRLRLLRDGRPALVDRRDVADAALRSADTAITEARTTLTAARRTLDAAETTARDAARAEDRAAAAIERAQARADDVAARLQRLRGDLAEALADADRAAAAVAQLPDRTMATARVAGSLAQADAARMRVADARAARSALDAALVRDRERAGAAASEIASWHARAADAAGRIAEIDERMATIAADRDALRDRPAALAAELARIESDFARLRAAAAETAAAEQAADARLRAAERIVSGIAEMLAAARETRAGASARAEGHEQRRLETGRLSGERFQCPPPLLPRIGFVAAEVGDAAAETAAHDRLLADRDRIGPVNLIAETELAELEAAQGETAAERADLAEAVQRLRGSIGTLNREGRQRLLAAFEAVDAHFRRLFGALFDGGQARLELIDSDDPLEAGLEILVQPPGKRLQSLTLLSGGEQALTAVALIFALFLTNPAPICVLDEVDAPLDDANIDRFCDLLDRMAADTDTRYLIVTHNAATMSRMHRLFGVTMIERGVSRLVSVDLGGATSLLAAE